MLRVVALAPDMAGLAVIRTRHAVLFASADVTVAAGTCELAVARCLLALHAARFVRRQAAIGEPIANPRLLIDIASNILLHALTRR